MANNGRNMGKEDISKFMAALQKAKEDLDGAKTYARLNPVCSRCKRNERTCLLMPDGIRCDGCRILKQACPRMVDFWIVHVARRLGRSEAYVKDLYFRHGVTKRPRGTGGSSPSRASGSKDSKRTVQAADEEGSEEAVTVSLESDEDEAEDFHVFPSQLRMKPSSINTREAHSNSKGDLESQRKESALWKQRAETAEGNFVALVGRVQDFRTSLRSEIRTMPLGVNSDGFSRLSAAMETTIDDAGLYLRDISDTLKQSRTSWEIHHGTQPEIVKVKGGPKTSMRQMRQRSPESPDRNMQKRRKI